MDLKDGGGGSRAEEYRERPVSRVVVEGLGKMHEALCCLYCSGAYR